MTVRLSPVASRVLRQLPLLMVFSLISAILTICVWTYWPAVRTQPFLFCVAFVLLFAVGLSLSHLSTPDWVQEPSAGVRDSLRDLTEGPPVTVPATITTFGDVLVLELKGKLVGDSAVDLSDMIREFADKGQTKILLDLAAVRYIDSVALGAIIRSHVHLHQLGGRLLLVGKPVGLFAVAGLADTLTIYRDRNAAIASLSR